MRAERRLRRRRRPRSAPPLERAARRRFVRVRARASTPHARLTAVGRRRGDPRRRARTCAWSAACRAASATPNAPAAPERGAPRTASGRDRVDERSSTSVQSTKRSRPAAPRWSMSRTARAATRSSAGSIGARSPVGRRPSERAGRAWGSCGRSSDCARAFTPSTQKSLASSCVSTQNRSSRIASQHLGRDLFGRHAVLDQRLQQRGAIARRRRSARAGRVGPVAAALARCCVLTHPGHSTETFTCGAIIASSWCSVSEIATTACLLALYGPMNGAGDQPRDRRGVHDVRLGLLHEQRHERADAVDDAPEVRRRSPTPTCRAASPTRARRAPTPALLQNDVHAAEALDRGVGRAPASARDRSRR